MSAPLTFDNGVVRLYQGDARQVLGELPAESVHCAVTSPPYWGLRDYGLEPLIWGGDADHAHEWGEESYQRRSNDGGKTSKQLSNAGANARDQPIEHAFCPCGAWRGSLGLEPTIDLYVQHVVEVFREARRVLRKDGTLWLNMGDSYVAGGNGSRDPERWPKQSRNNNGDRIEHAKKHGAGLKPKDLCMMPARVALALQADGWWLRSDIVWSKPNPMPESVTDRPTRSHEYLFLLTKVERYYYDAEAIREDGSPNTHRRAAVGKDPALDFKMEAVGRGNQNNPSFQAAMKDLPEGSGRNRRSVWEIATEPYPEAHFATFPQKLVEPCILAGTSQRGTCPDCGAPWERAVEVSGGTIGRSWHDHENDLARGHRDDGHEAARGYERDYKRETTDWRPTCECSHEETVPATVLDPFAGSGTVAYVAQRLGRRSIGIDLSADYLALAEKRMRGQTLPMKLEQGDQVQADIEALYGAEEERR